MTKDLKDKAIDFKGKKYVLVADRVVFFNEEYPYGAIKTESLTEGETEIFKAIVTPDIHKPERFFTGFSQATWGEGYINQTSALENAETSAVGRALALMGIGVIDSIASIDEIKKTTTVGPKVAPKAAQKSSPEVTAFKKQIKDLCDSKDPLLSTEQDYKQFVFKTTGLELIEINYPGILEKLSK